MKNEVKILMKDIIITYGICILYGLFLCLVFLSFFVEDGNIIFSADALPKSYLQIFINNLLVYIIFLVPIVGKIYYLYSMIFVHAFIVQTIVNFGVSFTMSRLVHYPIEILAFSLALVSKYVFVTKKNAVKQAMSKISIVLLMVLGILLLFISAIIENSLR